MEDTETIEIDIKVKVEFHFLDFPFLKKDDFYFLDLGKINLLNASFKKNIQINLVEPTSFKIKVFREVSSQNNHDNDNNTNNCNNDVPHIMSGFDKILNDYMISSGKSFHLQSGFPDILEVTQLSDSELQITYSLSNPNSHVSEIVNFLVVLHKDKIKNPTQDIVILLVKLENCRPELKLLSQLNFRENYESDFFIKVFSQKMFDLTKIFQIENQKTKNYLIKNNFINTESLLKFTSLQSNDQNLQKTFFAGFDKENQKDLNTIIDKTNYLQDIHKSFTKNEKLYKDIKLVNVSSCSFTFYVKVLGPFYLTETGSKDIEITIKEKEVISLRVYSEVKDKRNWPMTREMIEKGIFIIQYQP